MKIIHWLVQLLLTSPKFPGRDFLIEKLPKWFLKNAPEKITVSTRFGFKILLYPQADQNIENIIYERGVYEYGIVKFIQQYLREGDSFVDVGANIGFLSMVASVVIGKQGYVHSFEPVPVNADHLEANVQLNVFENILVYPVALGDEPGEKTIYLEPGNKGGASMSNVRSEKSLNVECKLLDAVIPREKIKMIKVDVEGFELPVLKGALYLILRDQPILIIEVSKERNNEGEQQAIYNWIRELKFYHIYKLKNGKERPSELIKINSTFDLPDHDNIICLPFEK